MQASFWIISSGPESSSILCRELAKLRFRTPRPFGWYVSSDPSRSQTPPVPMTQLNGAVIIVDRLALDSEAFVEAVRLPIATMADRDDFSVFPWLRDDLSIAELKELAEQGNPLAISLVENIQLDPSMESLPGLIAAVRTYLDNLETLRAFSVFEKLSIAIIKVFGRTAAWVSFGVVLGALGASVIARLTKPFEIHFSRPDLRDFSVILVFAAICILLFKSHSLFSLLRCGPELVQSYPRFWAESISVSVAGLAIGLLGAPVARGCHKKTILVGVALGVMLVAFVRKGRRARLQTLPFAELPQLLAQRTLLSHLYDLMAENTVNTGMPLFEPVCKRAFISYSRSSVWSSRVADEMTASLRHLGAFVFLDRPSLRLGLSWKRQLRWAIVNSNVFIVVLDENAARREWIAAEFAAAYRSKIVKRTPEIFVIHPKGMDFSGADTPTGAFFAEIMVQPSRAIPRWMRSRMAPYDTESRGTLCRAIWSYPTAGTLGVVANALLAFSTSVIVPVLLFASMLGLPLLGVHAMVMEGRVSPSTLFASHSDLAITFGFTSALMGGFCLRSALRSFADVRRSDYSYVPGPLELLEAMAFFGAFVLCLPWLHLMDAPLVSLAVFFGVEWGNYYALCVRTWKKQAA